MLRVGKDIENLKAVYNDGKSGEIIDLLFSENEWEILSLIIEHKDDDIIKKVLISPKDITDLNIKKNVCHINKSSDELKNSKNLIDVTPHLFENDQELQKHLSDTGFIDMADILFNI
jgi:hypothetical protein